MKKLIMFLGVLFVGTFFTSFTDEVGYYPGVRLYYDWDGDGYYVRTSLPQSAHKYNCMLTHQYITIAQVKGKEPRSMDNHFHVH